jgi:hypothetical protein
MERPSKIQQLYAYAVCLVAVITTLIVLPGLLDAITRRQAPFQSEQYFGGETPAVAETFDAYKLENPGYRFVQRPGTFGERTVFDTLSEEQARQRYELRRDERVAKVRYETSREILTGLVLLAVSLALFIGHWRWLRVLARSSDAPAA